MRQQSITIRNAALVAIIMPVVLAGCGQSNDSETSAVEKAQSTQASTDTAPETKEAETSMDQARSANEEAQKNNKVFPPP